LGRRRLHRTRSTSWDCETGCAGTARTGGAINYANSR
jgi:hypothetical protein